MWMTCPHCSLALGDDGSLHGSQVICPRCTGYFIAGSVSPIPPQSTQSAGLNFWSGASDGNASVVPCPRCNASLNSGGFAPGTLVSCPYCQWGFATVDRGKVGNDSFSVQSTAPNIEAWCDTCGEASQFARQLGGAEVPCPNCGEILKVPASLKSAGIKKRSREHNHKISSAMFLMFVGCAVGYLLSWQLGSLVFSIGLILLLIALFSSD